MSPASVTEGTAASFGEGLWRVTGVHQEREVDRREILRLVDEEVLVDERVLALAQLAADELVGAQEEGVVLGIEEGALVLVELFVVGAAALLVALFGRGSASIAALRSARSPGSRSMTAGQRSAHQRQARLICSGPNSGSGAAAKAARTRLRSVSSSPQKAMTPRESLRARGFRTNSAARSSSKRSMTGWVL